MKQNFGKFRINPGRSSNGIFIISPTLEIVYYEVNYEEQSLRAQCQKKIVRDKV